MHDIGKNIVTVVLQCNNFDVVNMGVMVPCHEILARAKVEGADIVGLSGLITPSLEEMQYVAGEMQKDDHFRIKKIPLMIGGATTSRVHTAVKISPHYEGPVVYVPDASRSVSVAQSLLSDQAAKYIAELNTDYDKVRTQHANKKQTPMWPLAKARANATPIDWAHYTPPQPKFIGRRVFKNFDLAELANYIDWGPFFQTWDLAGPFPAILKDEVVGSEAVRVYADAQRMLKRLIEGRWLTASGVIGLYPANSVGDDIEIYTDESRSAVAMTWYGLRQQAEKTALDGVMRPSRCLADFVAPKVLSAETKAQRAGHAGAEGHNTFMLPDYIGLFAVTAGLGAEKKEKYFNDDHDDYSSIMLKSLADRLAEAFAEAMHKRVREDLWGYAAGETLNTEDMIAEKYQGIRPAPGYPACPDHSVKKDMFELLQAADIGMALTESLAMTPAASVSGFYLSHPQSVYFNVGKIGDDQLQDLAKRRGEKAEDLQRLLAPNL
ncbi:vitamin B12 dependent-methionine synthase activation domain-containing protein [Polaromonas sp.]|uniref:vitamin B12 dependent-methionine synthase activation domain-containing protein n=1 Tax=Polaromonas sp. TaxID=1869339 RepID=UPI003523E450